MVYNQSYTYMISIPRRGYLLLCLSPFSERLLVGRDMRRTLALWAQLSYVTSSAYVLLKLFKTSVLAKEPKYYKYTNKKREFQIQIIHVYLDCDLQPIISKPKHYCFYISITFRLIDDYIIFTM